MVPIGEGGGQKQCVYCAKWEIDLPPHLLEDFYLFKQMCVLVGGGGTSTTRSSTTTAKAVVVILKVVLVPPPPTKTHICLIKKSPQANATNHLSPTWHNTTEGPYGGPYPCN